MRKIYAIAALVTLSLGAAAQNGNHTVEVTNDYISQMSAFQKTGLDMAVPDSLLHFDYKFDYSVFETPYKGAYEFSPYHIHVQPQASKYDAGKFYLRAGAGYSIHPVLEFVAAAVTKSDFALDIYNEGYGFYGRNAGHGLSVFGDADPFTGYDASDRLGLDARWIKPKVETRLGIAYDLIAAGDAAKELNSMTHSGSAYIFVTPLGSSGFDYNFDASGRFTVGNEYGGPKTSEILASLGGALGFGIGGSSKLMIDFSLDTDIYSCNDASLDQKSNLALFKAVPSYNFNKGPFAIKLGASVAYSTAGVFSLAPDVYLSASMLSDHLEFFAGADGGQSIVDHFSMKSAFHRATAAYSAPGLNKELVHGYAGFKGHAGHVFEWGLKAGYHNWKSKSCEALYGFNFAHVTLLYADASFALKTERVDFDGDFRIAKSSMIETADIFSTPRVSGDVRLMYNRNKRLYAGVWAQGQTSRNGIWLEQETSLPGWVNLGVCAEYKVGTKWGIWLEAGNLLCQKIWRNPVCAEKDPYATLGICLKF